MHAKGETIPFSGFLDMTRNIRYQAQPVCQQRENLRGFQAVMGRVDHGSSQLKENIGKGLWEKNAVPGFIIGSAGQYIMGLSCRLAHDHVVDYQKIQSVKRFFKCLGVGIGPERVAGAYQNGPQVIRTVCQDFLGHDISVACSSGIAILYYLPSIRPNAHQIPLNSWPAEEQ